MAHEHSPHLAHHFNTPQQQFHSGKLGMWIFLATEVLLFGGMFCWYSVYRANHPEIFIYAHRYLDYHLGGINTVVLICSSFTMAWAVRCAQINQRRGLIALLCLTLLGGCGFLGIKYIEYSHKWREGLRIGKYFTHEFGDEHAGGGATHEAAAPGAPATGPHDTTTAASQPGIVGDHAATQPATASAPGKVEHTTMPPTAIGPAGRADTATAEAGEHAAHGPVPRHVNLFFNIYFGMTGLHGIHVIAGMIAIGWVLVRSIRGHFSSAYFTPVDLVGLYWHLVDLIWIFLFPLLYLIH